MLSGTNAGLLLLDATAGHPMQIETDTGLALTIGKHVLPVPGILLHSVLETLISAASIRAEEAQEAGEQFAWSVFMQVHAYAPEGVVDITIDMPVAAATSKLRPAADTSEPEPIGPLLSAAVGHAAMSSAWAEFAALAMQPGAGVDNALAGRAVGVFTLSLEQTWSTGEADTHLARSIAAALDVVVLPSPALLALQTALQPGRAAQAPASMLDWRMACMARALHAMRAPAPPLRPGLLTAGRGDPDGLVPALAASDLTRRLAGSLGLNAACIAVGLLAVPSPSPAGDAAAMAALQVLRVLQRGRTCPVVGTDAARALQAHLQTAIAFHMPQPSISRPPSGRSVASLPLVTATHTTQARPGAESAPSLRGPAQPVGPQRALPQAELRHVPASTQDRLPSVTPMPTPPDACASHSAARTGSPAAMSRAGAPSPAASSQGLGERATSRGSVPSQHDRGYAEGRAVPSTDAIAEYEARVRAEAKLRAAVSMARSLADDKAKLGSELARAETHRAQLSRALLELHSQMKNSSSAAQLAAKKEKMAIAMQSKVDEQAHALRESLLNAQEELRRERYRRAAALARLAAVQRGLAATSDTVAVGDANIHAAVAAAARAGSGLSTYSHGSGAELLAATAQGAASDAMAVAHAGLKARVDSLGHQIAHLADALTSAATTEDGTAPDTARLLRDIRDELRGAVTAITPRVEPARAPSSPSKPADVPPWMWYTPPRNWAELGAEERTKLSRQSGRSREGARSAQQSDGQAMQDLRAQVSQLSAQLEEARHAERAAQQQASTAQAEVRRAMEAANAAQAEAAAAAATPAGSAIAREDAGPASLEPQPAPRESPRDEAPAASGRARDSHRAPEVSPRQLRELKAQLDHAKSASSRLRRERDSLREKVAALQRQAAKLAELPKSLTVTAEESTLLGQLVCDMRAWPGTHWKSA